MARNLEWIARNKYPHEKIIVWAHNYHISKYNGHYPEDFLNNAQTMGGTFTSDSALADTTYIIGFTSYRGTAGRIGRKKYRIRKPKANSFENWINPDYDYAFTDFKKYRMENPGKNEFFLMSGSVKGNAHHTSSKAQWTNIFDGIFYIKEMYPCRDTRKVK